MRIVRAAIAGIEYHVPQSVLTSEDLAREFPEAAEKTGARIGIKTRHIAAAGECASDLAVQASQKLFASGVCRPSDIDHVLFCSQTPDYLLPTTACLIQDRLGIPKTAGAFDLNLSCSGFVYCLALAKGLIETGQAANVLLLTADTYSKLMHPQDRSVRVIFGDAAAATLVRGVEPGAEPLIGPFVFGTDGGGAHNLIVRAGGMRFPRTPETALPVQDDAGNRRSADHLFMDGAAILNFSLREIPPAIARLLEKSHTSLDAVDLFIFHQANQFIVECLRSRLKLPAEKTVLAMEDCGNTVSSSIPIALRAAVEREQLRPGLLAMLAGFGGGYSWAATLVRWLPASSPATAPSRSR